MSRLLNRFLNGLMTVVLTISMIIAGLYAGYALWDNNSIYSAALDVQADMIRLKPEADVKAEEAPSFEELLTVNSDVCAWITLDGTAIDYPVLQGENNLSYINTDVYGNFALAGSIFLDARCDKTFAGRYQMLYGHHMDNHGMFGDINLYKEERFFRENSAGVLILPDRVYDLKIIACLVENASSDMIFESEMWHDDIKGLLDYILRDKAVVLARRDEIERMIEEESAKITDLKDMENTKILAMSTCSSEFTDARTVLLAVMSPRKLETALREDAQE